MESQILIVGYHKVGRPAAGEPTGYYVSTETFRSQLRQITSAGWQAVSVDALLNALNRGAALPRRALLLTFDDAYRMLRTTAAPILRDYGVPSAVFVPVDFVGRLNEFDRGVEPPEPICDWDDLRQLQRSGMSIESHTMSHRRLSALDADWSRELEESKRLLESKLSAPVRVLAYPYGDNGGDAAAAEARVRAAGYEAACVYCGGVMARSALDRYLLQRVPMSEETDLSTLCR